jgi:hypothetical protein
MTIVMSQSPTFKPTFSIQILEEDNLPKSTTIMNSTTNAHSMNNWKCSVIVMPNKEYTTNYYPNNVYS